ncbi:MULTISPECIES: mevalonate kinase [Lactobacillus]|uniref:Mevalonate kinase n=1 Tax=Lactobacillus xujianguonis TaxID=2495899 RepID=A0A437SXT3_9LACO|nr:MULTISPECIES: mevalonate kinase [Lactobacillus]RVU71726.1 mevalonate kinase [Lactobacillus xujianguonis]RVU77556.1 mevalonate kinase [Lactobacillus xujianguonis]
MKSSYLAHGKVILIGEHSVVYGYNALCLPIKSLHIKTTVEASEKMWMDTQKYHGPFFEAPAEYDGLKYVVKTMLQKTNSDANLKITYTGEIPMERGFGSSATVALGTTNAMNDYFKLNLSEAEIMAITNHAEMINHGKASGLDAATVNSDYLVFFNKQDGPKKLSAKLNGTLLIMDTGQLGNTKEAVTKVRQQYDQTQAAKEKLAQLGQLADQTQAAWLKQDQAAVGSCFNQAQEILASFGLSTSKIDQLREIALANHALGFKLSGGGLGGIVIALCTSPEQAEKIAAASKELISNYWIEEI